VSLHDSQTSHLKLTSFKIRCADIGDIISLIDLNRRWQKTNLESLKNGFLSAEFGYDTFLALVQNKEIVIAEIEGNIAGYYLVNNYSIDGILIRHQKMVDDLIAKSLIPINSKVGLGVQVLIDLNYQGIGLMDKMLHYLINLMAHKYEFLFSTISKENQKSLSAHIRSNWRVVDEIDNIYCIIYGVVIKNKF